MREHPSLARKTRKKRALLLLGIAIAGVLFLAGSLALPRYLVQTAAQGRTYSDVQNLPVNKVGLVLGCTRTLANGQTNLFFRYRIGAAYEAFTAGKVEYLIVSGDNHVHTYDEPSEMKDALVNLGVPEDRIVCDYAGFRTLDSVVRAREVFQEERITVISQAFHNQRAIFIGRHRGLEVVGYNAHDVNGPGAAKTDLREHLARTKAVLDVFLLRRGPRFLGDPIPIGDESELVERETPEGPSEVD